MMWCRSHRADREVLPLADRHYNRQKPGTPQFVPPGSCAVLKLYEADDVKAFWVTSAPRYARHEWQGAWVCSAFRNESSHLSSLLITQATAATRFLLGAVPALGMVTFINPLKVKRKRDFGRCYLKAGWRPIGHTKGGLIALGISPADMPEPCPPIWAQLTLTGLCQDSLFAEAA